MRTATGTEEPSAANLLQLAHDAYHSRNDTVWQLFNKKYPNLTAWQQFKAGLMYVLFYRTSLLSNTIKAYVKTIIKDVHEELTAKDSKTRNRFIIKFIDHSNNFLESYNSATKAYGRAEVHLEGGLDGYRKRANQAFYKDLTQLCSDFSKALIDKHDPEVQILPSIPKVLKIGYLGNRLIRYLVKSFVLPAALKTGLEEAEKTTSHQYVPFKLAMTQFFREQFDKLGKMSVSTEPKAPSKPPIELPGTEQLPAVIKNLMIALQLEPFDNKIEIKNKFDKIEQSQNFFDTKVQDGIETGIKVGFNYLFNFLNNPETAEQLLSSLVQSASKPFSGEQPRNPNELNETYEKEYALMESTASKAFEQLVRPVIKDFLHGPQHDITQKNETNTFVNLKNEANASLFQLSDLCERMQLKLNGHLAESMQPEIAAFALTMKKFSEEEVLHFEKGNLDAPGKNALQRAMNPIYSRAQSLLRKLLYLQEYENQAIELNKTLDLLNAYHHCLNELLHSENLKKDAFLSSLPEQLEKIRAKLEPIRKDEVKKDNPPTVSYLKRCVDDLKKIINDDIYKENQCLQTLEILSPTAPDRKKKGLLEQLADFYRGSANPYGFAFRTCLEEIQTHLKRLPTDEHDLILQILTSKPHNIHLPENWKRLSDALQCSHDKHGGMIETHRRRLQKIGSDASKWIEVKQKLCTNLKDEAFENAEAELKQITIDLKATRSQADQLTVNSPVRFGPNSYKYIGAAVGGLSGIAGSFMSPFYGPVISASAGALSYFGLENVVKHGLKKEERRDAALRTLGASTIRAFGAYFLPTLATEVPIPYLGSATLPLTAAALGAKYGWQIGQYGAEKMIDDSKEVAVDEAMKIFKNAYKFVLSNHIYHGAATRLMREVAGPAKPTILQQIRETIQ